MVFFLLTIIYLRGISSSTTEDLGDRGTEEIVLTIPQGAKSPSLGGLRVYFADITSDTISKNSLKKVSEFFYNTYQVNQYSSPLRLDSVERCGYEIPRSHTSIEFEADLVVYLLDSESIPDEYQLAICAVDGSYHVIAASLITNPSFFKTDAELESILVRGVSDLKLPSTSRSLTDCDGDSFCTNCPGVGQSCLECATGYYLYPGFDCQACPEDCETCDAYGCLTCKGTSNCCPSHRGQIGNTCACLDPNCATCDIYGCLTLVDPTIQHCGSFRNNDDMSGNCVCNDPDCEICDFNGCVKCKNPGTNCCENPWIYDDVDTCECPENCISCDTGGCFLCLPGDTTCCPDGRFFFLFGCFPCNPSCSTCDDVGCLTCQDPNNDCCSVSGRAFNNGKCCEDSCGSCDDLGCLTCKGTDDACCPDGRYFDGTQCADCAGDCLTCQGTPDNCTECRNSELSSPECCPDGQNDDDKDGVCVCDDGNIDLSQCSSCPTSSLSYEGSCCSVPTLRLNVEGPGIANVACTEDVIVLSVKNLQNLPEATYVWSVSDPSPSLEALLLMETGSTLTLSVTELQVGVLAFQVTMSALGVDFVGLHIVEINDTPVLSICLSESSPLSLSCSEGASINALVLNSCLSPLSYDWQSSTGLPSSSSTLEIPAGALPPGTNTYTLTVSAGGLSETQTIEIEVEPSGIEAVISPVGPLVDSSSDLIISGEFSIGDNLSFSWECSGDCPQTLLAVAETLTIPSAELISDDAFTIILTISDGVCSDTAYVDLLVSPCASPKTKHINPDEDYRPELPLNGDYKIVDIIQVYPSDGRVLNGFWANHRRWEWTGGYNCYLVQDKVIEEGELEPGTCYLFNVKYCLNNRFNFKTVALSTNSPPSCLSDTELAPFSVTRTGNVGDIQIDGCTDPDGDGSHLKYSLTVIDTNGDGIVLLNYVSTNFANYLFTDLGTYTFIGRVCDTDGLCEDYVRYYDYTI